MDSEGATGIGTLQDEDGLSEQLSDDDDVSDTAWDTDLDIEGCHLHCDM